MADDGVNRAGNLPNTRKNHLLAAPHPNTRRAASDFGGYKPVTLMLRETRPAKRCRPAISKPRREMV